jgi:hypothetical protein
MLLLETAVVTDLPGPGFDVVKAVVTHRALHSAHQARSFRARIARGETLNAIARSMGVSHMTISGLGA